MGRPPTPLRSLLDGIFYVVKSGCPWGFLPKSFPPWQTTHRRFRKWSKDATWILLNHASRALVRTENDPAPEPRGAVLDSQADLSDAPGGKVGYDAGKKIKGRKRFTIVNPLSLLLGVVGVPANGQERAAAQKVLGPLMPALGRLQKLWVDGGYNGADFAAWVRQQSQRLVVEVIKRSDEVKGFEALPKRWVVERTFGWLVQHRRLVRDYEETESSAEGFIAVALIRVMVRRMAK